MWQYHTFVSRLETRLSDRRVMIHDMRHEKITRPWIILGLLECSRYKHAVWCTASDMNTNSYSFVIVTEQPSVWTQKELWGHMIIYSTIEWSVLKDWLTSQLNTIIFRKWSDVCSNTWTTINNCHFFLFNKHSCLTFPIIDPMEY